MRLHAQSRSRVAVNHFDCSAQSYGMCLANSWRKGCTGRRTEGGCANRYTICRERLRSSKPSWGCPFPLRIALRVSRYQMVRESRMAKQFLRFVMLLCRTAKAREEGINEEVRRHQSAAFKQPSSGTVKLRIRPLGLDGEMCGLCSNVQPLATIWLEMSSD